MHYIREAGKQDMETILSIIGKAQAYLKEQGSPQWQNGYGPTEAVIAADIDRREGYVLVHEGEVRGYAALIKGVDDAYTNITDGTWKATGDSYVSIHRVAVDAEVRGKGLAKLFLHDLVIADRTLGFVDIRIDTHAMNKIMEKVIFNEGFEHRGIICFPIPDGERRAYQLVLE